MAYQSIGRGSSANDGTGDDLRSGAGKLNANFVEVYTKLGDGSTLTADTVTLNTATQTLTNKTLTAPTITGAGAIAGVFTGNITGNVTGNASGTSGSTTGNAATATALAASVNIAGQAFDGTGSITIASTDLSDTAAIALLTATQALTNKTISSASNTLTVDLSLATVTGTTAEFNTALSDDNFATLAGIETLTNKSLTAPTITGAGAIAGAFTGNITGDVTGQVIQSTESQTGDGATTIVVDPTKGLELLTSSAGAEAAGIADGGTVGQTITVLLEVDGGGDVTLTPATFLNGTTIVFADAGDSATMVWTGTSGWAVTGTQGSPTIA